MTARPIVTAHPVAVAALEAEIRFQDPDFDDGRQPAGWLVSRWNDAPGRTEDEVRDVIRGAIRRLEAHASPEPV